jgi:hypothetical protein
MKLKNLVFLSFTAGMYALGCGDHGDDDGGHSTAGTAGTHAGTHSAGGSSGSGGEAGSSLGGGAGEAGATTAHGGEGGEPPDAPPQPPVMESVSPLSGALHVTWMNVSTNCDKVELWRKDGDAEYMLAYTLTGVAEAQHDSGVEPGSTYCYKARCTKGDDTSAYSNEKCGTP